MNKRYQVFVSSTFADLKDERSKVIQTIMELDCIPAGMEIFPAIDEEQFEFIKKIIDDCDYYILIIGGRYGSTSLEGISYTEMEYDYAISKNIKVMAFLHSHPEEIPLGKSELDSSLRAKLDEFRKKVSTGRLIKFWRVAEELPGQVALSLSKTIKTYPAIGWIRSNTLVDTEVYKELNEVRKENKALQAEVVKENKFQLENLADLEDKIKITGKHNFYHNRQQYSDNWEKVLTWGEIFSLISPYLLDIPDDSSIKSTIGSTIYNLVENKRSSGTTYLDDQIFQTIKIHLTAIDFITVDYSANNKGGKSLFWKITENGKQVMMQMRSVKK
ncbi:DUF4062 domain-containing protein [Flavobacterium ginsenosidimutans]|uniref:DUF4062 domain-containing protein n=1 Tax=Flavobacterium ginsenosidimutans TaxID=687844 RepID=UPI000DABB14D|nr:DUF4062 domain-containing protein [Flavobacterium ginsenosidimutans]KAF2335378.1 DUF4062 domain-containing protein [Flavobacterium ginsenosidimutans]